MVSVLVAMMLGVDEKRQKRSVLRKRLAVRKRIFYRINILSLTRKGLDLLAPECALGDK
jgi:hypothetical protein